MDEQNRNLVLAMVLSGLVLLTWFILFPPEQQAPTVAEVPTADGVPAPNAPGAVAPPGTVATGVVPGAAAPVSADTREAAIAASERVAIDTPLLTGSISLTGGRIDDLALKAYRETIEPGAPIVTLLTPAGASNAYYALHGWVPGGGLGYDAVPGPDTEWSVAQGSVLAPGAPVTLTWDNGAGLTFEREIAVDDRYMFSVEQRVRNATDAPVRLAPYGVIARHGRPETVDFFILHEGVVAKTDGTLEEVDYDDVADLDPVAAEGGRVDLLDVTEAGWIGFTDKYWMTTLIPGRGVPHTAAVKYVDSADVYQTETRLPALEVAPGAVATSATRLFAGAKEWETIRDYEAGRTLDGFADHFLYTFGFIDEGAGGIDRFVDSIDWGWFYFLTKPIFMMLHGLDDVIGNMGVAIIVLTLIIKALLLPLAYKSYVSMARMKELQPEMEKLKERAGDDRQKMQQGMMELYRTNKVNPAAGCLPILLQIPIFFSLYKVIFVTLDLRHAPFFGVFQDLSAPDPTSILNLFGLLPIGAPEPGTILALIFIGVLPILLGVSMYLQQKLNPTPTDPTQAMIFAWLPWVFMFMLGGFASGLVIYWIANNTITFIQQYSIMWSQGMRPDLLGNIRGKTAPPPSKPVAANASKAPEGVARDPDPDAADDPAAPKPGEPAKPRPTPRKRKPRSKR